jgi:hypothetical protein
MQTQIEMIEYAAAVATHLGFPKNQRGTFIDDFCFIGTMLEHGLTGDAQVLADELRARFDVLESEYQSRQMSDAMDAWNRQQYDDAMMIDREEFYGGMVWKAA